MTIDLIGRQDAGGIQVGVRWFTQPFFQGSSEFKTSASVDAPLVLGPFSSYQILGKIRAVLRITSAKGNITNITVWDSAPDISTLPLPLGTFEMINIQPAGCSPPCAGAGTCDQYSPVCVCPSGFNGTQCQTCATGHFGPTCQSCPENCTSCDDGMSGSGRCLDPTASNSTTSDCKCVNGECDGNGGCKCLHGWGPAENGTECAQCLEGYYLNPSGACEGMI